MKELQKAPYNVSQSDREIYNRKFCTFCARRGFVDATRESPLCTSPSPLPPAQAAPQHAEAPLGPPSLPAAHADPKLVKAAQAPPQGERYNDPRQVNRLVCASQSQRPGRIWIIYTASVTLLSQISRQKSWAWPGLCQWGGRRGQEL